MERKGFYKSNKFPQRTCSYYKAADGLASDKAYCLASGSDGTVYIGTENGLNYTKADGSFGTFKCDAVKTIYSAKNGSVYFASGNSAYCASNGKITKMQSFESEVRDMSGIDDVYLLTADALYKLEDGKFERFFHNEVDSSTSGCVHLIGGINRSIVVAI